MAEFEAQESCTATKMLCKLFVEKVQREQQELAVAAANTEPQRIHDGWKLNIEQGVWVRERKEPTVDKSQLTTVQETDFSKMDE